MQLILETESTADLKTNMSLSEDNVDKSVSDILPAIKNGDIANGDVTAESNDAAEIKKINDVDKFDQIKEAEPSDTNNVLEHNGETTISENADVDTSNVTTTDIFNGDDSSNMGSIEDIEPVAQSESVESEKVNEENCKERVSNASEKEAKCGSPAHVSNKDVTESEVNATEPVDIICNNAATETSNIETSHKVDDNQNSNPCQIEHIKQEITENTEFALDESSNEINSKINLNEHVDIKQKDDEVCDEINTDTCEDATDIKKEKEESLDSSNSEINSTGHQTLKPAAAETNEEIKLEMIKSETAEKVPVPEETMETDNTENDVSDENDDLLRFDTIADNQDPVVHEDKNKELSAVDIEKNESSNTSDVTSMDVDENIGASNKNEKDLPTQANIGEITENIGVGNKNEKDLTTQANIADITENIEVSNKNEKDLTTQANIAEITKSNGETVLPIENNSSLLNTKNADDGVIVNLDDTESVNVETESALTKSDNDQPVLDSGHTEETENVEKASTDDQMAVDEIIDLDEPKDSQDSKSDAEESKNNKENSNKTISEDLKPIQPVLKLSNTLDILSDDEEEQATKIPSTDTTDSKCINIEDDDDIMLIDDDTSGNESKSDPTKEQEVEKQVESKPASPTESVKETEDTKTIDKVEDELEKDAPDPTKEITVPTSAPEINEKPQENKLETELKKPLIPENFLKTCKKNLVDMTRDELEEFCILKIVESILDRSNLSEIKNKLKTLTQNLEDYKKKAMMLQKQNRDLQVVFKSVQEDVKKASDAPIVPLKITRSVGMQVLMSDKPDKRRRPGIAGPSTFANNTNKQVRSPVAQGPRPQKPPTQPIPVPRLVPASPAIKLPLPPANTSKVTSPLPNGVKSVSPVQKGEKRTHNRMQSVTVDLTDDEPPNKIVNRTGPMPPVRLVPSQNLLATPRAQTQSVNSPRKVYIPISGPQGQNVRPGQTIMLKTVPSGPRTRGGAPPPHMVRMPQSIRMTRPQGLRHPAPLPECMKQYQPPNWKALPPAPDLKLAKVENGIVISWKIEGYQEDSYEEIASYQLYAYQETTSPPNTALWKKIGDVKALPLPMACTLTQFMAGYKYYFAVRAVDIRSRLGPFSLPGSILLLNKM